MFILQIDRRKYLRVRAEVGEAVYESFGVPCPSATFLGQILPQKNGLFHKVKVGETYASLSALYGVSSAHIAEVNGNKPLYPTCRIFIPQNERTIFKEV